MKKGVITAILFGILALPSISFAKGAPLFFQTGDELFEIEGAPKFDDGFSVGYACKRLGLFGADVWTWDCQLMAINLERFAAGELGGELKAEYAQQYSLSDRKRNIWNHYGIAALAVLLIGITFAKSKRKEKEEA